MPKRIWSQLRSFLASLFRQSHLDDSVDEEIRSSREQYADDLVAQGMAPADALRAARLEYGSGVAMREAIHDVLPAFVVHSFWEDCKYTLRGLRKNPSFAAVAVITMALGIGVVTAVFSTFYTVILRPLPYAHSEELVRIWASYEASGDGRVPLSGPLLFEIQRRNATLSAIGGIWSGTPLVVTGERPEQLRRARVTPNFFDVLGVHAAHGRTFRESDGGQPVIVLTDTLFRERFGARSSLVGQGVRLQEANTLIGVLPPGFQLCFAPDSNVPYDVQVFDTWGAFVPVPGTSTSTRAPEIIRAIGRVRPGVSIANAASDLERVASDLREIHPEWHTRNLRLHVRGLQADAFQDVQAGMWVLSAGALFVLLICCVNVMSLLLARANDRSGEFALRLSLGASRTRILCQLTTEAGVLSLLAGAGGLGVGWGGFRLLLAIRPERFFSIPHTELFWPAVAVTLASCATVTVLFSLAPAAQLARSKRLLDAGNGLAGISHRRSGNALIVTEVAAGFLLVAGAGLAVRTAEHLIQLRPGFEAKQLLTFQIPRSGGIGELEEHLAAVPGVERIGAVSHLPLDTDTTWTGPFRPAGSSSINSFESVADYRSITPEYFSAMRTRLIAGRPFRPSDRADSVPVVIVDERLAGSAWPGENAIGKTIDAEHVTGNGFEPVRSVVVGVVEHVHNQTLTRQVRPQIYTPFSQNQRGSFPATFVVRTALPPLSLAPAIRDAVRQRAPHFALGKVRAMEEYVGRDVSPYRFTAALASTFGGLSLCLVAMGTFGVLSYRVSRRRREIGIRMALGASSADVQRLIVAEGLSLAIAGVVLGGTATVVLGDAVGGLVHGISTSDPVSHILAVLLLPIAALLGCWWPARRASSTNPSDAIRQG